MVQAESVATASQRVEAVGGQITEQLPIIRAVAARLTPLQRQELNNVRVYADAQVSVSRNKPSKKSDTTLLATASYGGNPLGQAASSHYPTLIGATDLYAAGIDGEGVTVAVVDTGIWDKKNGVWERLLLEVDTTGPGVIEGYSLNDPNGHGTHVASAMMSNGYRSEADLYEGVAPMASMVSVKAFNEDGSGSYLSVIKAIGWVVDHADEYGIRAMNLSFSATPQSHYWDDPMNQAVMEAWQAGIVVVAAAGNLGPDPMSIGVPGNVPYVITVGAMTDNYTPRDASDDQLTSFSSAGPTHEGFIKPELVAPGGHVVGRMDYDAWIPNLHPESIHPSRYHFTMSGTSQAAAMVSGVVSLMLDADPNLTPDEVKCRLMASAQPAVNAEGRLAYSVFQQGAGVINALEAVNTSAMNCANQGLDIALDLSGVQHYGGPANQDEGGNFYVMDPDSENPADHLDADGFIWSQGYIWSQGFLWSQAYVWSQGYVWSQAFVWSQAYVWSQSLPWDEHTIWSDGLSETAAINHWVEHE